MDLKDMIYEKRGRVALVTFNRPDRLNAFRRLTLQEFTRVLDDVRDDDAIRVLLVTGKGRAFSAGQDLEEMGSMLVESPPLKDVREGLMTFQAVTRKIVNLPKIVISALNGVTVGVGVEIAIASDIRLAAESANFSFAEVKRCLFETNGVMYLLPRIVGFGQAMDWLASGDRFTADEAFRAGLVTRVLPDGELLDAAMKKAESIAANAPISVRLVKQVLHRSMGLDLESVMGLEVDGMYECLASSDIKEGVQSFLEKRPPEYKGE